MTTETNKTKKKWSAPKVQVIRAGDAEGAQVPRSQANNVKS